MKERFGVTSERAMHLRFHTQTAGVQLTAQQPELNLVRVALQALAAVLEVPNLFIQTHLMRHLDCQQRKLLGLHFALNK